MYTLAVICATSQRITVFTQITELATMWMINYPARL